MLDTLPARIAVKLYRGWVSRRRRPTPDPVEGTMFLSLDLERLV